MKVDFNKKFKDYKGNESGSLIADELARVMFGAGVGQNGDDLGMDEKYIAYTLCGRLNQQKGIIDINVEEASLIKRIAAKAFIAGGYGQIYELIENKTEIKKGGK